MLKYSVSGLTEFRNKLFDFKGQLLAGAASLYG